MLDELLLILLIKFLPFPCRLIPFSKSLSTFVSSIVSSRDEHFLSIILKFLELFFNFSTKWRLSSDFWVLVPHWLPSSRSKDQHFLQISFDLGLIFDASSQSPSFAFVSKYKNKHHQSSSYTRKYAIRLVFYEKNPDKIFLEFWFWLFLVFNF